MSAFNRFSILAVLLLFGCMSGFANAQATRTWVSGVGDDANPCSRTAPCKTFAGAISKTAANGAINVLDPGGFGGVTITKSITIEAEGALAGILVSGTNSIIVNVGTSDVVTLRGLQMEGLGNSPSAVSFLGGAALIVENVKIEGFSTAGINFVPTNNATLTVRDSRVHTSGIGINIQPAAAGSANVTIDNVQLFQNIGNGLQVQGAASVNLRNSVISSNSANGIAVIGGGSPVQLMLDNVIASENSSAGLLAQGSAATVRMSGSTLSGNTQGIQVTTGAQVISFGNNRNRGNILDGAPTSTLNLQ